MKKWQNNWSLFAVGNQSANSPFESENLFFNVNLSFWKNMKPMSIIEFLKHFVHYWLVNAFASNIKQLKTVIKITNFVKKRIILKSHLKMLFASKMAKSPPMVFPLIQNTGEMFSIFFLGGGLYFLDSFLFFRGFLYFFKGKIRLGHLYIF